MHAVARRVGLLATRRLGQHFLIDRTVLETIIESLALTGVEDVLEVGCGIGTLTQELASRARRVVAIDVDPACVRATEITQRGHHNVQILEADVRRVDPHSVGLRPPWTAAGNLPYRLTGTILSRLFERDDPPAVGVFLVQREVAARLCADSGGWSLATVALRSLASIERIRDVPPESFEPAPRVHSSVIRMRPADQVDLGGRAEVIRLARLVFQQRRKTLRHGMTHALGGNAEAAARVLAEAAIDPQRRPGTLGLDEWDGLARAAGRLSGEAP